MEEIIETYKVYGKADDNNRLININSSAFLRDTTEWTQIDEGTGDKYHHAQGNYLDKPIVTDKGIYRYRLIDGAIFERSEADIAADEADVEIAPTVVQRVTDLETASTEQQTDITQMEDLLNTYITGDTGEATI